MNWKEVGRRGFLKRAGITLAGLAGGLQWAKVSAQPGEFPPDEMCARILDEVEKFNPERIFEYPECLYAISKNMQGEIAAEVVERMECADSRCDESCITLKTFHFMNVEVISNRECDSDISAELFDGQLEALLNFTYIEDGHQRGYHHGSFKWTGNGGTIVGMMSGMINVGTHRRSEACEELGHWEGQLEGMVVEGEMEGCCVRASYAARFEPLEEEGANGGIELTLEGLLFCRCE